MRDPIKSTALAAAATALAIANSAAAQTGRGSAPASPVLEEVIVTARKVEENINRVPISISAITADNLEERNIRNFSDLTRAVPALTFQITNLDGQTTIALRGVRSTIGAATTGVYLDDVALQKSVIVSGNIGSGQPLPDLFDIARVEVLRGPQGTLYGGSSEGGAVRFITPTPSLTSYSGYARGELSTTKYGEASYDVGAAIGGPIVADKLGFRASAWGKRDGGYIDRADPRTGTIVEKNVNVNTAYAFRGSLLWAPSEDLQITLAGYASRQHRDDQPTFTLDIPTFTTPAIPFPYGYTRPSITYPARQFSGPLDGSLRDFVTAVPKPAPRTDILDVGSLTLDYETDWFDVKSISAITWDKSSGNIPSEIGTAGLVLLGHYAGYIPPDPTSAEHSTYYFNNRRHQVSQEIRLSSKPGARLSWVAGAYFLKSLNKGLAYGVENIDAVVPFAYGLPPALIFGVDPRALNNVSTSVRISANQKSLAGFADVTYALTEQVKLNAGVRYTHEEFRFQSFQTGYLNGPAALNPSVANGLVVDNSTKSNPITPKASITYQIDDANMVYVSAARGYRNGGVNGSVPNTQICNDALAALGGSKPTTYDPDSVWSYEAGGKVKLFGGRARVNASLFQIDWTHIQLAQTLPVCRYSFTVNAGTARSRGFDLQAEANIIGGLSGYVNVGYSNAKYTETIVGPPNPTGGPRALIAAEGDRFPVPAWNVSAGLEYRAEIVDHPAYIRADYTWASSYPSGYRFGAASYNPDTLHNSATTTVNMRAGVNFNALEVAVFARNLLNSQDRLSLNYGRGGCTSAACTNYAFIIMFPTMNTFRPRTIGISASYRY